MMCKAFLESLESSNFVGTVMKSLTANQQDLRFIYFLLKSGCPQNGLVATWLKPCFKQKCYITKLTSKNDCLQTICFAVRN